MTILQTREWIKQVVRRLFLIKILNKKQFKKITFFYTILFGDIDIH